MNLTTDQIRWILIDVFVLIISVAIHEFGHAKMADHLGDDTPRRQGRVSLNPLVHIDPIGTLLLPVVGNIHGALGGHGGGFGWGKPVQWQPSRIDRKWRMATAQILVAIAGPSMNVLLATLVATTHTILMWKGVVTPSSEISQILLFTVGTNFVLFFFNLIPVPPLDGGWIVQAFIPYKHRAKYDEFARFGPFFVLGVAFIPPIAKIFLVPANFCTEHLYKLLFTVFGMPS